MAAKPKSKKKAGIIAERERDVLALRESEERLRLAQQVAHIGTFEWNIQTGVNRWTPELEAMYGLQPGSFPGTEEAWEQLVHPDDRPEAVRRVNEAMEKGGFEGEWRVVWPDGTVRWLYGRSFVFKDESGKPLKLIGVNIDITERKCMEEELLRSRDELDERVKEKTGELLKTKEELAQRVAERTGELRAAHQSLVEKSKYLDAFFNHTITPLVLLDRDFNFIRVNEAYARACQKDVGEFPGHNHFEFYPSDVRVIFEDVIRTRQPVLVNARPFVFPDHPELDVTYWNWTLTPLLDDRGEVEALVFALEDVTERKQAEIELEKHRDQLQELVRERTLDLENVNDQLRNEITERKRTEEALRESEEKFRQLAENIYSVFWISEINVTTGMRYAYMSPAFEHIFGIPVERIYQDPRLWLEIIHPDDKEHFMAAMNKRISGDYYNVNVPDFRIVRPDGTIHWIKARLYPVMGADGTVHRFAGIADDVTERKRAEEALRESEELFKAIFDSAAVGIAISNPDSFMVDSNQTFQELLGYSKEELRQRRFYDITYPEDIDNNRQLHNQLVAGAIDKYQIEKRYIRKDGQNIWVKLTASAIRDADGKFKYNLAAFEDITERKRAEEALRESEAKFRALFEGAGAAIFVADVATGKIIDCNRKAEELIGKSKEEIIGLHQTQLHPADKVEVQRDQFTRHAKGIVFNNEESLVQHRDGRAIPVIIKAAPLKVNGREIMIGFFLDITERKRAEGALCEAKAQAELYLDLMGHDINNMHQIALGYLELALSLPPEARQDEMIEKPMEVLHRSAQLIRNVRKLQRHSDGLFQVSVIDVVGLLSDVRGEYGSVPGKMVTLNLNGCEHCYVRTNELLHDVFSNLVSNAIKHTGERADILVDLNFVNYKGGRYCQISIEDNGPGITDDLKVRIFNRGLKGTDKAKGMGLGLYLAKSLVESYGGRVWVEDRVLGDHTKGARFVVMLPEVEK